VVLALLLSKPSLSSLTCSLARLSTHATSTDSILQQAHRKIHGGTSSTERHLASEDEISLVDGQTYTIIAQLEDPPDTLAAPLVTTACALLTGAKWWNLRNPSRIVECVCPMITAI